VVTLWILQIGFDFFVAFALFQWLMSRKKIHRLEEGLRRLQIQRMDEEVVSVPAFSSTAASAASFSAAKAMVMPEVSVKTAVAPKKMAESFLRESELMSLAGRSQAFTAPQGYSNLTEKRVNVSAETANSAIRGRVALRNSAEAFSLAERLLGEGMGLKEVSEKTGLSQSELMLLGKVSQSYRNV